MIENTQIQQKQKRKFAPLPPPPGQSSPKTHLQPHNLKKMQEEQCNDEYYDDFFD